MKEEGGRDEMKGTRRDIMDGFQGIRQGSGSWRRMMRRGKLRKTGGEDQEVKCCCERAFLNTGI